MPDRDAPEPGRAAERRAWRFAAGLLLACVVGLGCVAGAAPTPTAVSPARPLPAQAGDAIPDAATQRALLDRSYAYFAAKDGGRLEAAYADFAPSVRAYLTSDLYRSQATAFKAAAGTGGERRIVLMTWEKDPPGANTPGLYVAADFVGRFPNIRLHCGYLMWHREADGRFRIVREEQSFLDEATARQMTPERLRPLPAQFGCPGADAGE